MSIDGKGVPPEDIEKIRVAAPSRPIVDPAKQRKLLVYSATRMYYHTAIPWGVEALRIMGELTGAYSVLVCDDKSVFQSEHLEQFDAVCFNNTCGSPFHEQTLRQNLLDFVHNGGGFVGIHCSAHTFVDWPPYGEMHGGYSLSHPWVDETVTVKIEDPDHPCVSCFGQSLEIVDEIYELMAEPYSREKLRVLASLDVEKTDMSKPDITRTDGDFALCWVRQYGKGRVFWSGFGHYENLYWNPQMLEHYLAGIQFALGDLEADTTPSA
jgi:type 1 glutamine amidotransferase